MLGHINEEEVKNPDKTHFLIIMDNEKRCDSGEMKR